MQAALVGEFRKAVFSARSGANAVHDHVFHVPLRTYTEGRFSAANYTEAPANKNDEN